MKSYIRTTHNFNNHTREWQYRGGVGGDMYHVWAHYKEPTFPYTLGVHALDREEWRTIDQIINETIHANLNGVLDEKLTNDFKLMMDYHLHFRKMLEENIQKELDELVKMDMVRVKEI